MSINFYLIVYYFFFIDVINNHCVTYSVSYLVNGFQLKSLFFLGKIANLNHDEIDEQNSDKIIDHDDEVVCTPTKKKKRPIFSPSSSDNESADSDVVDDVYDKSKVDKNSNMGKTKFTDHAVPKGDNINKDGGESCDDDESDDDNGDNKIQQFVSQKALENSFLADTKNNNDNSCCSHPASQVY